MSDEHELHDEPDVESHRLVNPSEEVGDVTAGSNLYYAYCFDERKRIGGFEGDRQVAINRASHHERKTGHSTNVYEKS